MVPEEQPKPAPEQSQSDSPTTGAGPRRRSRRGGRRHSRRREPRPAGEPLPPNPDAHAPESELDDQHEDETSEGPPVESTSYTAAPTEPTERRLPPLRPAPVVRGRDQPRAPREPQPPRERTPQNEPEREQPLREPQPERERGPKTRSVTQAIEQVNEIIVELKHALEEMDDILETLELAERQKIDDEREIENLQRALRRLNRPRDDERHH